HRVLLAAAQGGVLEAVGDAGAVLGHGAERYQTDVFRRVAGQMDVLGSGDAMPVFLHHQVEGFHRLAAQKLKAGMCCRLAHHESWVSTSWGHCNPSPGVWLWSGDGEGLWRRLPEAKIHGNLAALDVFSAIRLSITYGGYMSVFQFIKPAF